MAISTLSGPIRISQINRTYYVGEAFLSTIQKAVTFAVGTGYPGDVIIPVEYAGSDAITAVTGGASNVYIMDERAGAHDLYSWNGTAYALQPLTAQAADFESCIVDDSPVRTFANTPDGPGQGMVWPDIGIPVSQGSTWQSPSIDPATVPLTTKYNTFSESNVMRSLMVTGATYPDAVPTPSGQIIWQEPIKSLQIFANSDTTTNAGIQLWGANTSQSKDITYLDCQPAGATFAVPLDVVGVTLTQPPLTQSMISLRVGNANGELVPGISFINQSAPADNHFADVVLYEGGMQFRFANDNDSVVTPWLTANRSGGNPTTIVVNGDFSSTGEVHSSTYSSTAATLTVGDSGYGLSSLGGALYLWSLGNTVVPTGDFHVAGGIYGSTKNFRIPHPTEDDMLLTHSSLEGPEIAVFYRGEGETVDGVATIMLPDYFEALTREEGRTVQLTEIFEDEDAPEFGNFMAAGRVKDGKFQVRSKDSEAKFYWEVKAIRADVDELEVETERPAEEVSTAR